MVFKPSFKCLKNKKINLLPAILKQETSLYQNIENFKSDFDSKKKKWSNREGSKKKICDTNPLVVVVKRGKKG
jgi:hypothetical protein